MTKMVDNYQFDESTGIIEDGFEIFVAKHIQQSQEYTLKKLNTKNIDKDKYQSLLNQVSILKQLDHPNIIKCHKMLKTSNNIYLVYDLYPKVQLESLIANGVKKIPRKEKQEYIRQICMGLRQMKRKSIAHINLHPKCIFIDDKKTIKITNFFYGDIISNQDEANVHIIPPQSQFLAPQVLNQQRGSFFSDVYSFGKIFYALQMHKSEETLLKVNEGKNEYQQIAQLMANMTKQNPKQRISIAEVQSFFRKQSSSKFSKSPVKSNNLIGKFQGGSNKVIQIKSNGSDQSIEDSPTKSDRSIKKEEKSQKLSGKTDSGKQISQKNQKTIVLLILKRRNLAIFLLEMAQTSSKIIIDNAGSTILGYLMIKKSKIVLERLMSFLETGKGDTQIILSEQQRALFFKTSDYFRICSSVNKEFNLQQKWLKSLTETITKEINYIVEQFKQELNQDILNDTFFKNTIFKYISGIINNEQRFKSLDKKQMTNLGLMSRIFQFGSYQQLFEQFIDENITDLNRQIMVRHINEMDPIAILQNIKKKILQYQKQ